VLPSSKSITLPMATSAIWRPLAKYCSSTEKRLSLVGAIMPPWHLICSPGTDSAPRRKQRRSMNGGVPDTCRGCTVRDQRSWTRR
jgi:hypothetical protein